MRNVEIIVVGNEILLGVVQDTNSNYLCRLVRGLGGDVRHVAVVGDEAGEIASEVKASISRGADLLLTTGGLGPTDDDLTLEAIALALDTSLELNPEARALVEQRYADLARKGFVDDAELTDARLKMAHLPAGAQPIENNVGTAPAAIIHHGGTRIVALPGVPAELRGIVESSLEPQLENLFGRRAYAERTFKVDCNDESELAPLLRNVTARHPSVYIKSRAEGFGVDLSFRILVSVSAETREDAEALIDRAVRDLTDGLRRNG